MRCQLTDYFRPKPYALVVHDGIITTYKCTCLPQNYLRFLPDTIIIYVYVRTCKPKFTPGRIVCDNYHNISLLVRAIFRTGRQTLGAGRQKRKQIHSFAVLVTENPAIRYRCLRSLCRQRKR